jgi:Arc/MetJ-type ribon-helix-helix transcriptional regulator
LKGTPRSYEEREARLATLQAALIEGERGGEPEPFDFHDFIEEIWEYSLERFGLDFDRRLR